MSQAGPHPPEGTLLVIEAPGKREALQKTLDAIGVKGTVFSTFGHLLANPPTLWPSCINDRFEETHRAPLKPALCEHLKMLARQHRRVVVATDPDEEGHVIAADVYEMLSFHSNIYRGIFYGFDRREVIRGLKSLERVDINEALPGHVRRVLDRWIGATFSSRDTHTSVGRILSAALHLLDMQPAVLGTVTLVLPAADGGQPFSAELPITRVNENKLDEYLQALNPEQALSIADKQVDTAALPMDYIDAVITVSQKTGEPIELVQQRMQRLYEKQHISYPRTDARAYNRHTIKLCQAMAEANQSEINPRIYPINQAEHAHESIHLLDPAADLNCTDKHDLDGLTLSVIGQNMIRSGQPVVNTYADTSQLPEWASQLNWKRTVGMKNSWRDELDKTPRHGEINLLTPEQAVLKYLHGRGLGRPGTLVGHACRLLSRHLLNDDLSLTEKGQRFLKQAPPPLFEMDNLVKLEKAGEWPFAEIPLPSDLNDISSRVYQALKETGLLDEAEKPHYQTLKKANEEGAARENMARGIDNHVDEMASEEEQAVSNTSQ